MISVRNVMQKWLPIAMRINNKQRKEKESKMNPQTRTPCEKFSRAMGYIRPVSNFNTGKYAEFCERKTFTEENSLTAGARHAELMKKAA